MKSQEDTFLERPPHIRLKECVANILRRDDLHPEELDKTRPYRPRADVQVRRPYFKGREKWSNLFSDACDIARVECLTWYEDRMTRIVTAQKKIKTHSGDNVDLVFAVPSGRFYEFHRLIGEALAALQLVSPIRGLVEVWGIELSTCTLAKRRQVTSAIPDFPTMMLQTEVLLTDGSFKIDKIAKDEHELCAHFQGELQYVRGRCDIHGNLFELSGPWAKDSSWRTLNKCFVCQAEGRRMAGRRWHLDSKAKTGRFSLACCLLEEVCPDKIFSKYEKYKDSYDVVAFFFLKSDIGELEAIQRKFQFDASKVQFYARFPSTLWFNKLSPIVTLQKDVENAVPRPKRFPTQKRLTSIVH